ncbi:hypothetical protein J2S90_001511 [Arthrobacter bambusae]|uniref:Uncharacterized protein n=1 Tax=Arthrobacter bambusae TaxID=1338426 RepID=A0AAW8D6M0_9MICC|nr:hypothetical protein [Arthrobacter bambusae]MDQ0129371.1 hypothetical protein [Arthrobacter bambusae]MDQ0181016.1 hypothetical protein [Arthrobacter bambusae]
MLCEEGAGSLAVEIICENSFLECHPIRAVVRFTDSAQAGGRPPTTTTTQRDDDRSAGR